MLAGKGNLEQLMAGLRAAIAPTFFALILLPHPAPAATLFGQVLQGATVISDGSGSANVTPGTTVSVSIFLQLGGSEEASSFDAAFDLVVALGVLASADPIPVEAEWDAVAESTVGSQSQWAETSANQGGQRLVAHWTVDATGAVPGGLFRSVLAPGALAGRDLDEDPFFALVPISTNAGTTLAQVTVVPEPASGALCALGLVALGLAGRGRARWVGVTRRLGGGSRLRSG